MGRGAGSSRLSAGSVGGAGKGGTENPLTADRVNIPLRAYTKSGEVKDVTVSIQNTQQLDNIDDLDYARGKGRYRETNIYRALAADAENNAINSNGKQVISEPNATEGTWTRTDSVPVHRTIAGAHVLETTKGYVTKVGNENVYIQGSNGGYYINFAGMTVGQHHKTLTSAKADLDQITKVISTPHVQGAKGMLEALNSNNGRIATSVWKNIDFDYIAKRKRR